MKITKRPGAGIVYYRPKPRRAATALRRQAAFDDLMTQLLTRFAACTRSDIDASILATLQAMAEFAGADYAYVIVLSANRLNWSVSHDWRAPQAPPAVKRYQQMPLGTLAWSENKLLAGEVLKINTDSDYPPEGSADYNDFQTLGIQSLLSVPISNPVEHVSGTVGFLSHTRKVTWSEDVAHLKMAGDAIANLLARKRAEENLERQLEHVAALRHIDFAIANSLDLKVTLGVFVDEVIRQLQVHAAAVLLLNRQNQKLEYVVGRGFHTDALDRTSLLLGQGYAGQAALERRRVQIANLAEASCGPFLRAFIAKEKFVAYYGIPLMAKGQVRGVLEIYHRAPLEPDAEWVDFLETMAGQAAISIDNGELFDSLQRSSLELEVAYDTTLEGWSRALDLRDKETEGHTQRVTDMAMSLARSMHLEEEAIGQIRRGALLHDIGKMAIPDAVLLKPASLTDDEWQVMRQHPVYAYEWLSPIRYLRSALDIPHFHHEKWNGTGYPHGLKGEQIPLSARIFAVVDVWDALRSDRPYRPAWTPEKIATHIRALSGSHFDPAVAQIFLQLRGNARSRLGP